MPDRGENIRLGIDWHSVWKNMMIRCTATAYDELGGLKQWTASEARDFKRSTSSQYVESVTDRIGVQAGDRVLDIGCGPGTFAIPLAKTAASVTVVDTSTGMLQVLREEAERQGLRNIRCVNKFWRDVAVGKEVDEEFDVVVASNSMNLLGAKENGTRRKQLDWDLEDAVEKINRLGARNHATMPLLEHSTADVYEQLGREYYGFPDHIIVHNVLAQMGLSVGVSYLMVQDNMVHQSRLLSDRVSWTLNLDDKDKARVEDIVQNRIKVSDSNLQLWSLIQWTAARPD